MGASETRIVQFSDNRWRETEPDGRAAQYGVVFFGSEA
jgi:hypothetical protein